MFFITNYCLKEKKNGNVDHSYRDGDNLVMYAWAGYPSASVTNGKLYQTVKLETGTYRFDVSVSFIESVTNLSNVYFYAVLCNEIPDINNLASQALKYKVIPGVGTHDIEFTVPENQQAISMGFLYSFVSNGLVFVNKVELWQFK